MSLLSYDPIIVRRRGTENNPLSDITESKKIINNRTMLSEIPNRSNRVVVTGTINGVSYDFYEINAGTPELDGASKHCGFKVDYIYGLVDFPIEVNGNILSFKYMGSGVHYFPAARVYTAFDDLGNGDYDVTQTLQELVDSIDECGIVVYTPDKTKQYKISVDNNGNVISTLIQ